MEITTTDGRMETFVTHPERRVPFPAVVVYMDVWGIREELYDIARRIATAGYYAVVPDLYYRLATFPITLPPLRERPEDVSLLALHFMKSRGLGRDLLRSF